MKSTPPIARSGTSLVLGAVWPMYWPEQGRRASPPPRGRGGDGEAMQDLGHAHGHRGLAGAGVAAEAHVQRGCSVASPRRWRGRPAAEAAISAHAALDRGEAKRGRARGTRAPRRCRRRGTRRRGRWRWRGGVFSGAFMVRILHEGCMSGPVGAAQAAISTLFAACAALQGIFRLGSPV